ncbi:MAG TPA: DegV family protein [Corynebacterium xerosis]|uniref:DegV family protein n=1 Tax=Corynebacterium xerosis TaxID=1725 RepID=UPI001DB942E4|nr:DegV family protein [Corynebacterium xerosis]HJG56348.1 DegV family protein [Corynebacterium xerosis]
MTAAGERGGRAAGEANEAGESGGGVSDRADQRGRVQIVVDESACVAPDVAKRHGITVVALGLDEVDGEQTTSAIGPLPLCAAYARALERGADAGVVALHLGKGLSATWSNAVTAAAVLDNVHVVDSSSVGAGMGAAAIAAAEKAAEGGSLDECVAVADDVLERNRLWLYVPKLEPLRRGGRISTGQAVLSTALAIKPIVGIENGTLGLVAKCRTEAKVLDKLVDLAATEAAGRPAHVMLQHSGALERVEELHAMLSLELPEGSTFEVVDLPAALVAHTGPGAYAVGLVVAPEVAGNGGEAGSVDEPGAAGAGKRGGNGGNGIEGGEGADGGNDLPLPPTAVVGRDSSPLFTTVAAKLPTWSENRRAAIEKAEALAHAIAELARRDHSDPEGAAFGVEAREEAARRAADRANGAVDPGQAADSDIDGAGVDGGADATHSDAPHANAPGTNASDADAPDTNTPVSDEGDESDGGVVKQ